MFSPRKVFAFSPSMNTGAAGASPVPGKEMPMFATHTKQRRGRLHEQRGAALAELAIVMPLLLLL